MPMLTDHQSAETTKMLLVGDSGSGKTGALASLAGAGYNVRIIDLDNGADILANILRDPKSQYGKEALARVAFETITDPMKNVAGKLIPKAATVWQRTIKLLDNWKTETTDFGPVSSWTPRDVLVIDSLTFLCNAAMNFHLAMNARLGQQPHQSDWYNGQQMIEGLLQMLYDEGIHCNVIINCHLTDVSGQNEPAQWYPAALGKALPPKVGRYFNTILQAKSSGIGTARKHLIHTRSVGTIELKTSAPGQVEPSYPLETGLAQYFKAVRQPPAGAGVVAVPKLVEAKP